MVRIHVGQPTKLNITHTLENHRPLMDDMPPNIEVPPPATPAPTPPSSSLASRLLNVFAAPGEVFEELKNSKTAVSNWLAPALIAGVVGVVATLLMFSQPTIQRQMREQQERAMQKQVEAGKMTQKQADQALEMIQKFSGPMMKIFGSISAVAVSVIRLFWWGLILWLIARWLLKAQIPYMKAVEAAGLSSMIVVLGGIVSLLLMVILGRMIATPSLALLLSDFDVTNKKHMLLGAVNVFNFWLVAVMGLGLARLTGASFGRTTLIVLVYWVAMSLALIAVGMGQFAL
jgi:hypothetical protein